MKYSSTLTVESLAFPGVSFVLRKMTEKRRTDFRLRTADTVDKIQSINKEAAMLAERFAHAPDELDTATKFHIEKLNNDITALIQAELNPEYVRWGLAYIKDLELEDGSDAIREIKTADQLIDDGPPELFEEICASIITASNMSEEELKNFKLPSISGTPMVGTNQSGSVPSADTADVSTAETAENTNPTES
jgi:hypothetical protein